MPFCLTPGSPRAAAEVRILALVKADVGSHVFAAAFCIYCELTGQRLPLADVMCAMEPAEGSLPGEVPVCIRSGVSKGQTVFFPATLYTRASSPGLRHEH